MRRNCSSWPGFLLAVLTGLSIFLLLHPKGSWLSLFWASATTTAATSPQNADAVEEHQHLLQQPQQPPLPRPNKEQRSQNQYANDSDDQDNYETSCQWTASKNYSLNACVAETVAEAWSEKNIKQTEIFWALTEQETEALRKLGQRLLDLNYFRNKPSFVIRFLLQRKGDVDTAEPMFRKSVQWRIENKVDSILQDYHPTQEMRDAFTGALMRGLDKAGDPVVVTRGGSLDCPGLFRRFGHHEIIRYAIWHRELVWRGKWNRQYEKQVGRPIRQLLVIDDMQGVHRQIKNILNRKLIECLAEVVRLDKENYPHSVKKYVIIRMPKIFEAIWKVVKGMLDPVAAEKVAFSSPKNYVEDLANLVNLEYLPEEIVTGVGKGEAWEGFPQFQTSSGKAM